MCIFQYQVVYICYIFHIYSTSQFKPATFQVLSSSLWLLYYTAQIQMKLQSTWVLHNGNEWRPQLACIEHETRKISCDWLKSLRFWGSLQHNIVLLVLIATLCLVAQSCLTLRPYGLQPTRLLCPWDFPQQEYCSVLPFPPPGALPDPGIKPASPASPALAGVFFTTELMGSPS